MINSDDRIARLEATVEQLQAAAADSQRELAKHRVATLAMRLESRSLWAQQMLVNQSHQQRSAEFADRGNDCKAFIIETSVQTVTQMFEMTDPLEAARLGEDCVQSWRDYCQEHGIAMRL